MMHLLEVEMYGMKHLSELLCLVYLTLIFRSGILKDGIPRGKVITSITFMIILDVFAQELVWRKHGKEDCYGNLITSQAL